MVDYSIVYKGMSEDKKTFYTELNGAHPKLVIMKVYNTYMNHEEMSHEVFYQPETPMWHYIVNNSKNRYVEFRDSETNEIVGFFGLEGVLDFKDYDYENYVYNLMRKLPIYGKNNVCSVFNEIVCQNVYFGSFIDIDKDDVVVDIGFNYGLFSICALKKSPKRIIGFEPNLGLIQTFNENLQNTLIEVYNCAVSNSNEKINFYESLCSEMSTIVPEFYRENTYRTTEVDAYSFMHLVEKHNLEKIDYLKVDCEGAEYMIFQSIPDYYLSNNIKKMAIEYHNQFEHENVQTLIKRLNSIGFEIATSQQGPGLIYARK